MIIIKKIDTICCQDLHDWLNKKEDKTFINWVLTLVRALDYVQRGGGGNYSIRVTIDPTENAVWGSFSWYYFTYK